MAKGRRTARKTPAGTKLAVAAAVALVAVVAAYVLATRGGPQGEDAGGERRYVPVEGFRDVHGLAVDPEDPRVLYVATHHGLIRGVGDGNWSRVGDMQDDLMGFTMHPRDGSTFWVSGHPSTGGNMGVRKSADGGFTWETVWERSVDFHVMAVSPADPDRLWGYYAGDLYRSDDGGRAWEVVHDDPPAIFSLAASPEDADAVWAATQAGVLRSADGGRTWTRAGDVRAFGVAFDPTDARTMYAGGENALWKSTDGGATWTALAPPAGGAYAYLAVSPQEPDVVYVATYSTGIYKTADAGATWTQVKAPSR